MAWAISSSSASMTGAVAAIDLLGDVQRAAQHKRDDQRRGDGRDDDGQGASAHLGDFAQVEAEAQQDHRVLQDLLRRVLDARRGRLHHVGAVAKHQAERHADEDGEHRAAHHGQRLAEKPAGKGDGRAQADAGGHVLHVRHDDLLTSRDVNSDCRV